MKHYRTPKTYIFQLLLVCSYLTSHLDSWCQSGITSRTNQIWLGYFNQIRIHEKWETWTDLHLRSKDHFTKGLSQGVIRLGLSYLLNNDTKISSGYAFFNHFPADNHKQISQPEHRGWQQIQWRQQCERLQVNHRIRVEQRFRRQVIGDSILGNNYNFNWRFRYQLQTQLPIKAKWLPMNKLTWILSDEAMLNAGKKISINFFDQNRIFTGFQYKFNKAYQLQIGYMYIFQQTASKGNFRATHVARIFLLHSIDWRNKAS